MKRLHPFKLIALLLPYRRAVVVTDYKGKQFVRIAKRKKGQEYLIAEKYPFFGKGIYTLALFPGGEVREKRGEHMVSTTYVIQKWENA